METENKRTFTRQMYANDSEVGRMKLQSVKENLYEATTKVVLYSIEMYTKKDLGEWARTDLLKRLNKANNDLKRAREELEQGHISVFDITNGCSVLNDFVRSDTLKSSTNALGKKIGQQDKRARELEEELQLLNERRAELEAEAKAGQAEDAEGVDITEDPDEKPAEEYLSDETASHLTGEGLSDEPDPTGDDAAENLEELEGFFSEGGPAGRDSFDGSDAEPEKADNGALEKTPGGAGPEELEDEDDEGEDDEDIEDVPQLSEAERFRLDVAACKDISRIDGWIEKNNEESNAVSDTIKKLRRLTRAGGNRLEEQDKEEKENLERLRVIRNTGYAHKTEDELDISQVGTWEPEGGPLYEWAKAILTYIRTIEKRYADYAIFDEYYAAREGKEKFDGCKVYVQRQIKELYVNRSNIVLEFAGDLYDKEDEEFNFQRLIENMAYNWDTGIRYLTVVTNEDMPELNIFFKECLSGTRKYVDSYLIDRNALRDACKKKNSGEADYMYFRLLYHMNPAMEDICWKGRSFDPVGFAWKILYKIVKARNAYQLNTRLENCEDQLDGIDIKNWCGHRMLSEIYFAGRDDDQGAKLARNMEDGILEFCGAEGKDKAVKFRKAVRTSAQLYFYMKKDYSFTYKTQDKTLTWNSLEDVSGYIEDIRNFKSYIDIRDFVDDLNRSYFFKVWKNTMKKRMEEGGEQ